MTDYTVSAILTRSDGQFFSSGFWTDDIESATVFTLIESARKLVELSRKEKGLVVLCVIQNRHFDYFDGRRWVYHLREAKLYPPDKAKAAAKRL